MANTLTTALVSPVTEALSEALRNTAGLTQSVTLDPNPGAIAYNTSKYLPKPGAVSVENFTAAQVAPAVANVTTGGNQLTMSNWKSVRFHLTSEEEVSLAKNKSSFVSQQMNEAVNDAVQDVEAAILALIDTACGYGVTTAGTNPFDSTGKLDALSGCRATFNASGCLRDRSYVLGPAASQRYMNLDSVNRIDANADLNLRRQGTLGSEFGFAMRETPTSASYTKSTATGYLLDADAAKGATTLSVDTGSNAFTAGDVISVAGASHKYVVSAWDGSGGNITLTAPLLEAVSSGAAVTVATSDNRDFALGRRGVWLAIRPDAVGESELRTPDTTIITDPLTGIQMRMSRVPGYGLTQYQLSWVYGVQIWVVEELITIYQN